MSEFKNDNNVGDFDLFEIAYSLWKNKYTLIGSLIAGVVIAFLMTVFEKKNNNVYVEIGPNTSDTVFLHQLNTFNIDTSQIYRNFLANIKTRKIVSQTVKFMNPNINDEELNEKATSIVSQINVEVAENELADEFQDTSGFQFYRIGYTSEGNIDDKKIFMRSLIDQNNKYFIKIFNKAMNATIDYETEIYLTKLKAKSDVLKMSRKNKLIDKEFQRSHVRQLNTLLQEKDITSREQTSINDFSLDLPELLKNYEIAKSLGIKEPTFTTPANIQVGISQEGSYQQHVLNHYSFFLGTDVLNQYIENIETVLSKKNRGNIKLALENEESRLFNKFQEIALRQKELIDTNDDRKTKLQLDRLDEQMNSAEIYMDDGFRVKLIVRDIMNQFMSQEGFMLIEETSSISSEEDKNFIKYLIIFITLTFLLSSGWIFFN
ncbi:hypothetical protein N9R78_02765, partial [Pelagibacteraceae bacterium]|nr:hypothetical protein [Pelagibacteraceae bacterium]